MVHILQNACKNDKYNEKKYDGKNRPYQVTTSINILLIDPWKRNVEQKPQMEFTGNGS